MLPWALRSRFWNVLGWFKMRFNKPLDIPLPTAGPPIVPVPMGDTMPEVPLRNVRVCPSDAIPADERSRVKTLIYRMQVALYTLLPPMQPGLPPIDADPDRALDRAYTRLRRKLYAPPVLPAEYLGSPDLGSLATRGPYACFTRRADDGGFEWDFRHLGGYEHHAGLVNIGCRVRFEVDPVRRALRPTRVDTSLGACGPDDGARWERAKKIALCAATTEMSLVRHWCWVHLAFAHVAIATRNRLPPSHPFRRLLWPHVYGTQQSNDITSRGQMVRGGEFETIFSFTFDGMCKLFDDTYPRFPIAMADPEADAHARGVVDAPFETPTEANYAALFAPMLRYARDAVAQCWADPSMIRSDPALAAWLDELNALVPNGVGVTRADVDAELLSRLVARIVYMVSVLHEALGSHVWNYQLWTHRQPVRVYADGRREPLDVYQRLVNANYNLNVHRRMLSNDFGYLAPDAGARDAQARFRREMAALQAEMARAPWTVWAVYPDSLKVNINA